MRLLIIEDDVDFGLSVKQGLEAEIFAVDLADNGDDGLTLARLEDYDAIVLDMELPGSIKCRELAIAIRKDKPSVPIIVLTEVYCDLASVVDMLQYCDDFMLKASYTIDELTARLRALLRRPPVQYETLLKVGDLTLDPQRHLVMRAGIPISLSYRLFGLLEVLMRNEGKTVSSTALMSHNWDINADRFSRRVEMAVLRLRQNIDAPFDHKLLTTIPGRGYKLEA